MLTNAAVAAAAGGLQRDDARLALRQRSRRRRCTWRSSSTPPRWPATPTLLDEARAHLDRILAGHDAYLARFAAAADQFQEPGNWFTRLTHQARRAAAGPEEARHLPDRARRARAGAAVRRARAGHRGAAGSGWSQLERIEPELARDLLRRAALADGHAADAPAAPARRRARGRATRCGRRSSARWSASRCTTPWPSSSASALFLRQHFKFDTLCRARRMRSGTTSPRSACWRCSPPAGCCSTSRCCKLWLARPVGAVRALLGACVIAVLAWLMERRRE